MASLFKRLFSSGGTQTATVQVEEQSAGSSAEEKTVSQDGVESRAGEQPPSQEELNKFLYENFLDGAKPVEIPQTQEWAAASAPVVFEDPAAVNLREALELSAEDAISENDEASDEGVAEVTADASLEGGAPAHENLTSAPGDRESAPQVEAALPAMQESENDDLALQSSAHEMLAEIEVDCMALDSPEDGVAILDKHIARTLPPTLTELPEALRPTLTDVLIESVTEATDTDHVVIPSLVSAVSAAGHARIDSTEWAIEEALGNHKEWLDSKGVLGKKA